MTKIYRYEVPNDGKWHSFDLQSGVLHVACRRPDAVEFWAKHYGHPSEYLTITYEVMVVGTGQPLPDDAPIHVGRYRHRARRRAGLAPDQADTMTDVPTFEQWCIVELFGHQRFAGLVRQAEWPAGFARLDVPATDGFAAVTQLLNPSSIYRLTPTTEEIALAVAADCRPQPVHRYELERAGPTAAEVDDVADEHAADWAGEDGDDGGPF